MKRFDHIILGTGQATGTLLGGLLGSRDSIAVIEGHRIGGSCVNFGCTPTKTLVASARVAHVVARSAEYGIHVSGSHVDFGEVMARMNRVRSESNRSLSDWIESEDAVSLYRGWGRFVGEKEIRIGDELITADQIYINVGARARTPDLPGLDSVRWLDNVRILELTDLPEHLVIIGGGYIALEYAQAFRRFGSRVTILERGDQLMGREDADVADAVCDILVGEGVEVLLNAEVRRVVQTGNVVSVTIHHADADLEIHGSHLLVAAGRVPNSDRADVNAAGIHTDEQEYIRVDDHCRTNIPGVFAVGDVNGHGAFTHTSVNDAEIVLDLKRGGSRKLSDRIPVYALFIDPPLGRVGLTEKAAVEAGHKVLKAERPMAEISRAKEMGETRGFAKLLVDADSDLIIGASVLGPGGDEIINMFAAFMYGGLPCHQYRKSVLVHPTISELMPWVLDSLKPVG